MAVIRALAAGRVGVRRQRGRGDAVGLRREHLDVGHQHPRCVLFGVRAVRKRRLNRERGDDVDVVAGVQRSVEDAVRVVGDLDGTHGAGDLRRDRRARALGEHRRRDLRAGGHGAGGRETLVERVDRRVGARHDIALDDLARLECAGVDELLDRAAGCDGRLGDNDSDVLLAVVSLLLDVAGVKDHQARRDRGQDERDDDIADAVGHAAASRGER